MISHIKRKVKEGKVVKVEIEYDEIIKKITITGDFFLHPEDVLDEIEQSLNGSDRTVSEEEIISNIQRIITGRDAQMIGISPESIALLVREALV